VTVRVGAIVPAAGRGERLGAGRPKALLDVGGAPLLVHAVHALSGAGVEAVVVAAPPASTAEVTALVPGAVVVAGGATRQESVRRALAALPHDVEVVLVHDAARAFAPVALIESVAAAVVAGADAVVPVVPVADTVKQVDERGVVVATVDRSMLRAVQTPQGFRRSLLEAAHRQPGAGDATDDAALVEAMGTTVVTVPGSPEAFKVTRPFDVAVAEALLARRGDHVV
jgi:2-C-methyl-D-erythritol 4-phosphate cytidylyltransferase